MIDFDARRTYRGIEEKLAATTNPRHRAMLRMLLQHSKGEVEGDLDAVLGSLAPHPVYKGVRNGGAGPQPEGMDQVRDFYVREIFGAGRHVLESVKDRIVVDDHTIVTEGTIRVFQWGRDLAQAGAPVDDDEAAYLLSARVLIVWPFDAEGRIIGEESWSEPATMALEKVPDAEVPETFKAYIRRRSGTGSGTATA